MHLIGGQKRSRDTLTLIIARPFSFGETVPRTIVELFAPAVQLIQDATHLIGSCQVLPTVCCSSLQEGSTS